MKHTLRFTRVNLDTVFGRLLPEVLTVEAGEAVKEEAQISAVANMLKKMLDTSIDYTGWFKVTRHDSDIILWDNLTIAARYTMERLESEFPEEYWVNAAIAANFRE